LGQDFDALGFQSITFAFEGDTPAQDGDPQQQQRGASTSDIGESPDSPPEINRRSGASNGLDLRL